MVRKILISSIAFLLFGCAGFGIFSTSDPMDKLQQSCYLLIVDGRSFPAKRILGEAITICKETNDTPCLAQAYITSGVYFRALDRFPHLLELNKKWGFEKEVIEYQDRAKLSKEFFEKAEVLANGNEKLLKKIELAIHTDLDNYGMEFPKFCY